VSADGNIALWSRRLG